MPLNVSRATCPGVLIGETTDDPPIVIDCVVSVTLYRLLFTWPVPPPDGSINSVYVPVTGSCCGSMKIVLPQLKVLDNCVHPV